MRYAAMLSFPLALGACGINAPTVNPVPYDPSYLQISLSGSIPADDRQAVQELVDATLRIITSDDFSENLGRLDGRTSRLWLSPYGESMSSEDVARVYRGEVSGVRHVRTEVGFDPDNSTPVQGFYYQPTFHSRITLTPDVLRRWSSGSLKQQSCAINTMAHEISHTFSTSPTSGEWIIADKGKGVWPSLFYGALASYTIGSVAQCTMLLEHEPQYDSLAACLVEWGTDRFNSWGCDNAEGSNS
ncbi:MAG TPA: hypothetical protein VF006_30705 [Longimicrobium sp.]